MSSELLYFGLMCLGWFFLAGWALALVIACTVAFRQTPDQPEATSARVDLGRFGRRSAI